MQGQGVKKMSSFQREWHFYLV